MNGDHVRVRHPCETYCEECGASYHWNTPVPMEVFVEGNKGFLRIHQDCPVYRQDWRRRLLRVLDERLGQAEAMEMESNWAEAERRGELGRRG